MLMCASDENVFVYLHEPRCLFTPSLLLPPLPLLLFSPLILVCLSHQKLQPTSYRRAKLLVSHCHFGSLISHDNPPPRLLEAQSDICCFNTNACFEKQHSPKVQFVLLTLSLLLLQVNCCFIKSKQHQSLLYCFPWQLELQHNTKG